MYSVSVGFRFTASGSGMKYRPGQHEMHARLAACVMFTKSTGGEFRAYRASIRLLQGI